MATEPFWENFSADLARHYVYHPGVGALGKVKIACTVDGIWACAVYRAGRALRARRPGFFRKMAWLGFRFAEMAVRVATGIHLDVESEIAPGLYIGHLGAIYVGPGVRIGRASSLGQMCFVSATAMGRPGQAPVLGERVYLGVGAKVLGPVHVADGAAVGANAVVLDDVPAMGVAVGNPAKVVSLKGSSDFIYLGPGTPRKDVPQSLALHVAPAAG